MSSAKFAKIYRLGGVVNEFDINGYESVAEALKGLGMELKKGETVRVNGEDIDDIEDYEIEEGDTIVIVQSVKGGC